MPGNGHVRFGGGCRETEPNRGYRARHLPYLRFKGQLERDLISLRTKEALAAKKQQGVQLGKPKGTIQRSMYDKDLEPIKAWLKLGLSARKISEHLGYGTHISLNTYLKKRKIREALGLQ